MKVNLDPSVEEIERAYEALSRAHSQTVEIASALQRELDRLSGCWYKQLWYAIRMRFGFIKRWE